MSSSSDKKKNNPQPLSGDLTSLPLNPHRAGMPAQDSVVKVVPTKVDAPATAGAVATAGAAAAKYLIIQTNEVDEYEMDKAQPEEAVLAAAAAAIPKGDNYQGTDRKAAKLSKSNAKLEKFGDLKDLLGSLTPDAKMVALHIPTTATSDRVKEEQRNVQVKAFLYAASREADNDFHLIIGRDPNSSKEMYMNMELSGLPPKNSPAFNDLKAARDAFKKFFQVTLGTGLPGVGYSFPDPPIPVVIEGSLFFDATHSHGTRPGPKSLKSRIPSIWEIHPITKITFKP